MNIVKKNFRWAIITTIALLLGASFSYMLFDGTHYYSSRSMLLITIGALFLVLAYHIIKIRHRYKIRTLSEIIDRILSSGWCNQLLALLVLSIIAFLFSWALIDSINELHWNGKDIPLDNHHSFWLTICYFFDPGNLNITDHLNPGIQGVISIIVAILGMTLLTGLFVSTFTNIIEQRVESVKSGTITYKGISSHFVIIGFCELTEAIIRGIFEKHGRDCKIVLLTKENINAVRESLYDILNSNQYDGQLVIYSGDYYLSENLNRLNLSTSKEIYLLGEESKEKSGFDIITCYQKIVEKISAKSAKNNGYPIPVYVRMDNVMVFSAFQRLDMRANSSNTYFRPFNFSELWSRIIWNGGEIEVCDSFDQKKITNYPFIYFNDGSKYVHLVLCGFNQMAQALLIQTIRSAHFSNYTEENNRTTKITIVDPQIKEAWLDFSAHFRHFEQVYDIDIDLRGCHLEEIEKDIIEWSCDGTQKLIIAICSDNQNVALKQGLNLPEEVYYQHGKKSSELPFVFVEQKTFSAVWEFAKQTEQIELDDKVNNPKEFRKAQYDKYHNVYPFGMKMRHLYPNEIEDLKACIIHADYEDQWCNTDKAPEEKITVHHLYELIEHHEDEKLKLLIDTAFAQWYTLSENIKSANRYQTDNHKQIKVILEMNGISSMKQLSKLDDELLYLCSDIEHRRWIGERVAAGWQQSPYKYDGIILRQDSLRMHYDIRKTSEINEEIDKDDNVVINVLMLDHICKYVDTHGLLKNK
jgi:hypothetical protein